ncbi:MAG: methylenetetrahydrofolate reductase C-terminal domain-containing protein [Candidatus Promineifilaceae bacterium]|nr:methylenetetrahydrofolate reductase C-terminal domain-containing protein [Candidatus Promineifilaceae bacterium]
MSLGSWLRDHPRFLEQAYRATHVVFQWLDPLFSRLGYERSDRWLRPAEELGKKIVFDCRMCGQCILHSTGMTCPMTCPKNLRNGPCGGVRSNGHCEVKPEMKCVWVEAYERSRKMPAYGEEIIHLQPPVNRLLEGDSAWVNMLNGKDQEVPTGWEGTSRVPDVRLQDVERV